MTQRDDAVRAVVEAARRVLRQAHDRYARGEGMQVAEVALDQAFDALDVLPAAEPEGGG